MFLENANSFILKICQSFPLIGSTSEGTDKRSPLCLTYHSLWKHFLVNKKQSATESIDGQRCWHSIALPVEWCQLGFLLASPSLCRISQHQSAHRQKYRHYILQRHVRASPSQCHCTHDSVMRSRDLQAVKIKKKSYSHLLIVFPILIWQLLH